MVAVAFSQTAACQTARCQTANSSTVVAVGAFFTVPAVAVRTLAVRASGQRKGPYLDRLVDSTGRPHNRQHNKQSGKCNNGYRVDEITASH